ncbi:BQ2448_7578 [Microbotryum intermedium]|uniref:BQ2448_7578 protein n=1 Tax=Microbotryum intermedium TaxID=269621 RepID=A0A238FP47_9BASI|nr:BQ2448_7578 [Microbotryum intermedium]
MEYVNYYHFDPVYRFWSTAARGASSLTSITKLWTPNKIGHFEAIKSIVTSLDCLQPLDHSTDAAPFWVMTDASAQGIGGVFLQGHDWKTAHLIAYWNSLPLLRLKEWRIDLLGGHFHILTDHSTLEHFQMQHTVLSHHQAHWLDTLAEFDYDLWYLPSEDNIVANAMSRYSFPEPLPTLVTSISHIKQQILDAYETNPFCKQAMANIGLVTLEFKIIDALLYLQGWLIIPSLAPLCESILHNAHDAQGHLGDLKMYQTVQQAYFWPYMSCDVKHYVQQCDLCQQTKAQTTCIAGKLHALPVPSRPMANIAINFVGPLPTNKGFDCVLTITDRLLGYVHLLPAREADTTADVAARFHEGWHHLFGLPQSIVSDRDKLFTSKFWAALHKRINVKLQLSLAFHPETDGHSEKTNKTAFQILQALVNKELSLCTLHLAATSAALALSLMFPILFYLASPQGHASFHDLPSQTFTHSGHPSVARAIMSSTPSSDMNDLRTILQQLLQARLSDTRPTSGTSSQDNPTPPRVPAASSVTFKVVNKLKDNTTFTRWDRALKMSVPTPVYCYLQTGNFPAECILFNSLDSSIQILIQSTKTETPHELYVWLKDRFSPRDAQAYAKLIEHFWSMPQIPLTSRAEFNQHVNNDIALATVIRLGKVDIEQVLVAARLFNNFNDGLSAWHTTFLQMHEGKDKLPCLEDKIKSLTNTLQRICRTWTSPVPWQPHPARAPPAKRVQPSNKPAAQARFALTADNVPDKGPSISFAAASFLSATSDVSSLLLDSAASHHMVNDSSAFVKLHKTSSVCIGGVGGALSLQGKAIIELISSTGDCIHLSDVFFVPGCPANLISMFALIKDGITPSFTLDGRLSLVRGGKCICTGMAKADHLFHLDAHLCMHTALIAARAPKVPLLTLHRRLGHCSLSTLRKLANSNQVKGIEWTYSADDCNDFQCDACMASKVHKLPFPLSESHASLPLGLVHSDLLMFPEPSVSGRRYLITFIDNFSRKAWAFPLLCKSDALAAFQRWKAEVENSSGAKIKTLRSNNGGEYTAFDKFCAKQGLRCDKLVPYTPKQNWKHRVQPCSRIDRQDQSGSNSRLEPRVSDLYKEYTY